MPAMCLRADAFSILFAFSWLVSKTGFSLSGPESTDWSEQEGTSRVIDIGIGSL